ncbi:hypothetical protein C3747_167g26 [Trypanosoma cruzi]|uniref:Centrosomal protein of 19 kDa n=2 Tax=Trypanosoma cruzi TaxID=5693 RepID=Q4D690_TRYCC|nr:hypothetical protein, conserved [Trypanosoma cruzi]EAN88041.1 hypothetical protein, conserved [Trypanosoma cruzi]PWV03878.1 hypothetical protein C3747_167g26 [Trypanosoma cruzi]RNC47267.1 hypothetical protein TcCL_NonESM02878 [Trypanosoma cruzi]|eukprot:XP_809892.1 hypothetical protein [Trypanosoma cruzi strain CL Brener]
MSENISLTDLGPELWILVYHLYDKHKSDPDVAFRELTLRTRCVCSSEDLLIARSPSSLLNTQWYREMNTRYRDLRRRLKESQRVVLEEAEVVTRSLYPAGCVAKEYADALQTCAAMLTVSVPSQALARFTEYRVQELASLDVATVTVEELVDDLIERPVLDALTPSQWWTFDTDGNGSVSLNIIGLRARPAQIDILYTRSEKKWRCRIHLDGILHETGPTAPIARRLARTHGALLSEERFRTCLVHLQSLMKHAVEDGDIGHSSNSTMKDCHYGREYPQKQQQKEQASALASAIELDRRRDRTQKPLNALNKADVGLLYRDPEAALDNVDLNDADDVTLQEFKAKMEEKFLEKVVRPGDSGYEYDKRVEVKPTERSEWDDSD